MEIADVGAPEDHWAKASHLYETGRIEEAAAEWRTLLEARPEDADVHFGPRNR